MKKTAYVILLLLLPGLLYSQKNKKKKKEEASAESILKSLPVDSTRLFNEAAERACQCIDSVQKAEASREKRTEGFSNCIEQQVDVYQLTYKLMGSLSSGEKSHKIEIAAKDSREYKNYYYDMERWLKKNCVPLNKALTSNDEAKEKSYSENPDAIKAYDTGVPYLQQQKYAEALPWFLKAVTIDSEFVFAWDNLGICYRRTNQYEKAIHAYTTSLAIDPSGKTALQNLPVVYMLQQKPDEAITAYLEILKHYPGDAEVYYGIAIVYYNVKKDMPSALDYMCKAYNVYVKEKSAYRSDAEKVIGLIYNDMKKNGKEEDFRRILKDNNITVN